MSVGWAFDAEVPFVAALAESAAGARAVEAHVASQIVEDDDAHRLGLRWRGDVEGARQKQALRLAGLERVERRLRGNRAEFEGGEVDGRVRHDVVVVDAERVRTIAALIAAAIGECLA